MSDNIQDINQTNPTAVANVKIEMEAEIKRLHYEND